MNVSSLTIEGSKNITIFYDKEIECDEFVSSSFTIYSSLYFFDPDWLILLMDDQYKLYPYFSFPTICLNFGRPPQALVWIILLIIGAIVLIGLFLLLLWKCWTVYAVSKLTITYNLTKLKTYQDLHTRTGTI